MCWFVHEFGSCKETLAAATIQLEISNKNARLQVLQERLNQLRVKLDTVLEERGEDMKDVPGGSTGLLCRNFKGKGRREVFKIDGGVLAIHTEIRAILKQAAQELGQWNKRPEPVDAGGPREVRVVFVDPPGADPAKRDMAA